MLRANWEALFVPAASPCTFLLFCSCSGNRVAAIRCRRAKVFTSGTSFASRFECAAANGVRCAADAARKIPRPFDLDQAWGHVPPCHFVNVEERAHEMALRCTELVRTGNGFSTVWSTLLRRHALVDGVPQSKIEGGRAAQLTNGSLTSQKVRIARKDRIPHLPEIGTGPGRQLGDLKASPPPGTSVQDWPLSWPSRVAERRARARSSLSACGHNGLHRRRRSPEALALRRASSRDQAGNREIPTFHCPDYVAYARPHTSNILPFYLTDRSDAGLRLAHQASSPVT